MLGLKNICSLDMVASYTLTKQNLSRFGVQNAFFQTLLCQIALYREDQLYQLHV